MTGRLRTTLNLPRMGLNDQADPRILGYALGLQHRSDTALKVTELAHVRAQLGAEQAGMPNDQLALVMQGWYDGVGLPFPVAPDADLTFWIFPTTHGYGPGSLCRVVWLGGKDCAWAMERQMAGVTAFYDLDGRERFNASADVTTPAPGTVPSYVLELIREVWTARGEVRPIGPQPTAGAPARSLH